MGDGTTQQASQKLQHSNTLRRFRSMATWTVDTVVGFAWQVWGIVKDVAARGGCAVRVARVAFRMHAGPSGRAGGGSAWQARGSVRFGVVQRAFCAASVGNCVWKRARSVGIEVLPRIFCVAEAGNRSGFQNCNILSPCATNRVCAFNET